MYYIYTCAQEKMKPYVTSNIPGNGIAHSIRSITNVTPDYLNIRLKPLYIIIKLSMKFSYHMVISDV